MLPTQEIGPPGRGRGLIYPTSAALSVAGKEQSTNLTSPLFSGAQNQDSRPCMLVHIASVSGETGDFGPKDTKMPVCLHTFTCMHIT